MIDDCGRRLSDGYHEITFYNQEKKPNGLKYYKGKYGSTVKIFTPKLTNYPRFDDEWNDIVYIVLGECGE